MQSASAHSVLLVNTIHILVHIVNRGNTRVSSDLGSLILAIRQAATRPSLTQFFQPSTGIQPSSYNQVNNSPRHNDQSTSVQSDKTSSWQSLLNAVYLSDEQPKPRILNSTNVVQNQLSPAEDSTHNSNWLNPPDNTEEESLFPKGTTKEEPKNIDKSGKQQMSEDNCAELEKEAVTQ
jgi:hypothetical protein